MGIPLNGQLVGVPASRLGDVFPFHLAVDPSLQIVQTGPSLPRACPDAAAGENLRASFTLLKPDIEVGFDALATLGRSATLWKHRQSGLVFRGQVLAVEDPPTLVCLWSPWLTDLADMERHHLRADDFAAHDTIIDMLQTLQAQKIALQDERDLAEKLSEQRAELIHANSELSRQFSLLWDELVNLKQIEAETFKIALIANNTDNAVVMTDALGRVEWVNDSFTQMTGYTLEEMLGKTPGSILQGEKTDPEVIEYTRRQIRRGEAFGADILNYTKSGREYWVQFEVQPIRDEDNKITNWMAIERDITEQKKSELALLEAKKAAEAASRAKSAFLATMSHEIRTPMNAVLGTLSLLLDSQMNEEQGLWARSAYIAAQSLLNIIDDILDFSKIEADKLTLQSEDFDLTSLVDEVVQLFRIRTEAKGLTLSASIAAEVPQVLRGDSLRLRQILVNLVGNAVKFTERGSIHVKVFCQKRSAAKIILRFHVEDTGIGIAEDALASLFNQFVQVDAGATRRYGGTGLGLAISKRLATLMGGEIGVTSKAGEGSEFWFTAQLENANEAATASLNSRIKNPPAQTLSDRQTNFAGGASHSPAPPAKATILVAEDGEINRLVVTAMLGKAGYQIEVAENGLKALEKAKSHNYDLILMDVQMPEMDGYQVTSAIRSLPGPKARVPILAFTANAMQEDRNACLAAGMNDFISKPVEKERLLDTVAHWLRSGAATPAFSIPKPTDQDDLPALLDESALQALAAQTDERIMRDTVAIFFADTAKRIDKAARASASGNCQALGFEAHSIKSAAMTLGALRLAAACRHIESSCNSGDVETALLHSKSLGELFERTRAAFAGRAFLDA